MLAATRATFTYGINNYRPGLLHLKGFAETVFLYMCDAARVWG